MKIKQQKPEFDPITIILETREEATAFFDLVDRADNSFIETRAERDLLISLSNALTNTEVSV